MTNYNSFSTVYMFGMQINVSAMQINTNVNSVMQINSNMEKWFPTGPFLYCSVLVPEKWRTGTQMEYLYDF